MNRASALFLMVGVIVVSSLQAEETTTISEPKRGDTGVLIHEVQSSYQAGTTLIRVLQPDTLLIDKKYPVIYVLPVEAGTESRYGDGLSEVKKLDLHNKFGAVFVAPTFFHLPWYADHPTNAAIRQESFFIKVIVPFIDKNYPVRAETEGRLLLGFSKSGWGAWSLILRHPDLFGKAIAWDAPLMMAKPGMYGSGDIFGTADNFENYRVSKLLVDNADKFSNEKKKRLVLMGYGNFRAEHVRVQAMMDELKIAHEYRDGPERKHDWHSGWVNEAVELFLGQ